MGLECALSPSQARPGQYSWVTELSTGNAGCCTPGNGFSAAAVPQQNPLQSPHNLGESTQCPEMAQSPRSSSKGFTWGILLLFGSVKAWEGDSVTRQEGYGVSRMEKEMFLIRQGQSSPCGKATSQASLEILQGRIPHGRTRHLLQTGQHPSHCITFGGWLCPAEQGGGKPLQA